MFTCQIYCCHGNIGYLNCLIDFKILQFKIWDNKMQEENLDCLNNLLNISWRDQKEFEEMDEEKIGSEIENLSDQNDSGMNVSLPNNQSTPKVLKTVEVNDKIV